MAAAAREHGALVCLTHAYCNHRCFEAYFAWPPTGSSYRLNTMVHHEATAIVNLHTQATSVQNIHALLPVVIDLTSGNDNHWRG